jgi:hypothetical protein
MEAPLALAEPAPNNKALCDGAQRMQYQPQMPDIYGASLER